MRRTVIRSATIASAVLAAALLSAGPAAAARGNPGLPADAAIGAASGKSAVVCGPDHPGRHTGQGGTSPIVERRNVGGTCFVG